MRMRPVRMGRFCREILTAEARDYIAAVGAHLRYWAKANKFKTINTFTKIPIWSILPRTNCDTHNYGKVLWDTLEVGGVVSNDKYILPDYRGISYDAKKPELIVFLPN